MAACTCSAKEGKGFVLVFSDVTVFCLLLMDPNKYFVAQEMKHGMMWDGVIIFTWTRNISIL
jgi:hypothetical protein